jgi:hypothetical protein
VDALRAGLEREREQLLEMALQVPRDKLWEGDWSCGHILGHIPSMESWLASALYSPDGQLETVDERERDRRSAPLIGADFAVLLKAMSDQRRKTYEILAATRDLELTIATQWGPLTRRQVVRMIYRHDREHAAQLETLRVR